MDKMDTQQLIRHIHRSDLTALEKRYLEGLVEARTPREGMRLIDAEAAKNKVRKEMANADLDKTGFAICLALINMFDDAEQLPTIEAELVRHGRCEPDLEGYSRCSVCNGHESSLMYYRYCPNCGARMDGGTENDKS